MGLEALVLISEGSWGTGQAVGRVTVCMFGGGRGEVGGTRGRGEG